MRIPGDFIRLSKEALVKSRGGGHVGLLLDELGDQRLVLVSGLNGLRTVSRSVLTLNYLSVGMLALERGCIHALRAVGLGTGGGKCRSD